MKKLLLSTLLLSSVVLPTLFSTPARAQLDFWNKPKATAPNMRVALDRCLTEMKTAVPEAIQEYSFLKTSEFYEVRIQESYCEANQNRKFKDMGFVKGLIRYLVIDREYGSTKSESVYVVHGDDFPMLNNVTPYRLLND